MRSLHTPLVIVVVAVCVLSWQSSSSADAWIIVPRTSSSSAAAVVTSFRRSCLPSRIATPKLASIEVKSCTPQRLGRRHMTVKLNSYLALRLDLEELDDENAYATTITEEGNHLIVAGNYFKGIDENVGQALCQAGIAWSSDWSQVAEALEEASRAFWDVLSNKKTISPTLQSICRSVAQELEDISTIEGCSSIGPASSIPNWIAIHRYLDEAAAAYQDAEEEKDQMIYEILSNTSREIEQLIECF